MEKTLANWARKEQKKGIPVTLGQLQERVLMLTTGRSDQQDYMSVTWLENFRKKYVSGGSRSDSCEVTTETSASLSGPFEDPPCSSHRLVSSSVPVTGDIPGSGRDLGRPDDLSNFDSYERKHCSVISNGFTFDSEHVPEVPPNPMSSEPQCQYTSPERHTNEHLADTDIARQRGPIPSHPTADSNRCASGQTFVSPLPVSSITSSEEQQRASVSPERATKRHKSIPNIYDSQAVQCSLSQSAWVSNPTELPPDSVSSPSSQQDEPLRALYNIQMLLQQRPDIAEPADYLMLGKLTEKVKLLRQSSGTPVLSENTQLLETAGCIRFFIKRGVGDMSL